MADEIKEYVRLTCINGEYENRWQYTEKSLDQSNQGAIDGIVVVGTSEEDMDVGDVSTPGVIVFKNLDAANFITWGPKVSGVMAVCGKLLPGETAKFRVGPSATIRWVADTANVKVHRWLLET